MRIATFNVQNLRLRTRDGQSLLDAATDSDASEPERSDALALADRVKTAEVIAAANADVVALQEVFDIGTLDFFHDRFLVPAGSRPYAYRYCLKGNDGRGLNVAALSRRPADFVTSYADKTGEDLNLGNLKPELEQNPIFRRDCLEVNLATVTLFICHFKAPYPDPAKALAVRSAEARAVKRIIEMRFPKPEGANWVLLGDLNEPTHNTNQTASALDILRDGFAIDLLDRLPPGRGWTYEMPRSHLHTRPDRIFLSPALAEAYPDARPQVIRFGMDAARPISEGGKLDDPSAHPRASDHALVFTDLPGL